MKLKHYLIPAVALLCASCQQNSNFADGLLEVEGGQIQGYKDDGLTIFKGIPFAAPPVGELRWKAPQPVVPWDTILQATHYAAGPIQGAPSDNFSEDCLYLNVWTPAKTADEKLPVLVWIYGGGFAFGNAGDPSNDCEALARSTDGLILASLNYRVGQLGFLALPELTAESPDHVSGNYGVQDQIAALSWLKRNIAKFGGDPERITIFGESAGGISVSMLCASPLCKGLFQGAISQSGGSFGPTRPVTYPGENMKTLANAEQDGLKIMESLGASSLAELRAMDAWKFAGRGLGAGGWPVVDGYVIPDDQSVLYAEGRYNDVPVLIGYNSDEGLSFSFGPSTPEYYAQSTKMRYGQFAGALMKAYPYTEEDGGKQSRDLMRDAAFGWQTWKWACLQNKTGKSKVFLYYFDQHPDYPADDKNFGHGSPHGQDVNFVFQHTAHFERPEVDVPLSVTMGKYWTNFAKYGDPNGEGLPHWPAFTNDQPQTMYLTSPAPHAGPVPSEAALNVLDSYFTWRRTDEGKAWAEAN